MDIFIYIAKSAAILTLFYLVYILVLRKDTFFSANRHYLISGIIASLLLPIVIFTKTVYVDAPVTNSFISIDNSAIVNTLPKTDFFTIDWWNVFTIIYVIGIVFMSFRFINQLRALFRLIGKHPYSSQNGYRYIKVEEDVNPFSFFKYIVYNPKKHTESELKMILKHEQSHASQLHSIDIILSNLLLILQWANPFAWLYKKSIEENLEFIADSETVQQVPSKTAYQLSMLKVITSNHLQPVLATNFYQSLIKKRIIMLHKNQSSVKNQWKLLLILPLLGFFLWSFNVEEIVKYNDNTSAIPEMEITTEAPSVEKEISIAEVSEKNIKTENKNDISIISEKKNNNRIDNKITVTVDKHTTEAELNKLTTLFKETYNVTLKFNGIKRNSEGEIVKIKVSMKSKNSNASFNQDDSNGINEFSISYDSNNGNINIGNKRPHSSYTSSSKGNNYVYKINEGENGNISTWVSSDGHHVKKGNGETQVISGSSGDSKVMVITNEHRVKDGKHKYIIHEIEEDGDGGEEIHIISGSGASSNIWVTKDNDEIKIKADTIFYESKNNENDDSIIVYNGSKSNIFIAGDNEGKNILYFINGEKATSSLMNDIDPKTINNIEVLKGEKAVEKYGNDAKDGVVLITTKKN